MYDYIIVDYDGNISGTNDKDLVELIRTNSSSEMTVINCSTQEIYVEDNVTKLEKTAYTAEDFPE